MDFIKSIKYPWQETPSRLINYALEHAKKRSTFDKQVAFLLLDIGVETLFKVYLSLPEDVSKSKISYSKRKDAINGSFHDLVKGIEDLTSDLLNASDLKRVLYFHNIRNKLYHEGDGVLASEENLTEYCELARKMLEVLLFAEPITEEVELEDDFFLVGKMIEHIDTIKNVTQALLELRVDAAVATAILRPNWSKRSFSIELRKILVDYPDDEEGIVEERYKIQSKRIRKFSTLIGKKFPREYDWFVKKALEDVIYLQLILIFQKQKLDWVEEIDKYEIASFYPEFAKEECIPYMIDRGVRRQSADISTVINRGNEILSWICETQDNIEKILEDNNTPNPA